MLSLTEQASVITAIREAFEESGVLIGQQAGAESTYLDPQRLASCREALSHQELTFLDMIKALQIKFDLNKIGYVGKRTTPPGYPMRFQTRFYATVVPPCPMTKRLDYASASQASCPIFRTTISTLRILLKDSRPLARAKEPVAPIQPPPSSALH